ncbi:MAG: VOC family protein [Myxococcota bacterium]
MDVERPDSRSRLQAVQICFVVDDVPKATQECVDRFGWGPFQGFTADLPEASYRDWTGPRRTEVALGMAGSVQVELIHVHAGRDAIATYQTRYGRGAQHLGLVCGERDAALARLVALGARLDDRNEYDGVRIAFVDVPTGPAMFELLEPVRADAAGGATRQRAWAPDAERLALDRATVVARDFDGALRFFREAFGWAGPEPMRMRLRTAEGAQPFLRVLARSGPLEIELLSPLSSGNEPYSRHLAGRDHGLVHASARVGGDRLLAEDEGSSLYEWIESGERFRLVDWAGGVGALQLRAEVAARAD